MDIFIKHTSTPTTRMRRVPPERVKGGKLAEWLAEVNNPKQEKKHAPRTR